jgi:hypothetical protein
MRRLQSNVKPKSCAFVGFLFFKKHASELAVFSNKKPRYRGVLHLIGGE